MQIPAEAYFFCSFPSLNSLAVNKEALVADFWESSREIVGWVPSYL